MSFRYFENKECEYYPCHAMKHLNCLFCFCPLYRFEDCGGNYTVLKSTTGRSLKDCSSCCLPHTPEGYDWIMSRLKKEFSSDE